MKKSFLAVAVLFCGFSLFSATPRVAVVLSGGGARGIAHIAVLEAIEEHGIPVDMVIGTSMGALIGGLYSAGYTPAEIRSLVEETDLVGLFTEGVNGKSDPVEEAFETTSANVFSLGFDSTGIGSAPGIIGDQRVLALLDGLLCKIPSDIRFDELAVPFRCVGTDAFSGRSVIMRSGSLSSAIRGSISLPVIFTPYPQEDGTYVMDGGLVDNMPVKLAKDLGYDIVIACDVNARQRTEGSDLNSLSAVVSQTILLVTQAGVTSQYPLADLLLFPDTGDIQTMEFFKADEILRIGEAACEEKELEFSQLAERIAQTRSLSVPDPEREGSYAALPVPLIESVRIEDLSVQKLSHLPKETFFDSYIGMPLDAETSDRLSRTLERVRDIYGLTSAHYEMEQVRDGKGTLVIQIRAFGDTSSNLGLGVGGTLGFSDNTPNAAGWLLPTVRVAVRFADLFDSDFTFDTILSTGQTTRLDLAASYPFVTGTAVSLDLVVDAAVFRGSLTPYDSKVNGARTVDLDSGSLFGLGFDLFLGDDGRSDFGSRIRFLDLYGDGGDSIFLAVPELYASFVWTTQQGRFDLQGFVGEFSASVGQSTESYFSLRGMFDQRVPVGNLDSLGFDFQASVMRMPYRLISSYVDFGGVDGMPGYGVGSLRRDTVLGGISWQHESGEILGFPVHLAAICRVGTADGYDPYETSSAPDSSLFADDIGLEAGFGLQLGAETPIGDVVVAIGASLQGNHALIVGVF
jgi:NTE family protein